MMLDIWHDLPAPLQDGLLLCLVALWPILIIVYIHWRYRLWSAVTGLLRHHRQAAIAMTLLIVMATSVNLLFSILERAIVSGSARASDPFDLIVAAPGSKVEALLATVYLQPQALPLMPSDVLLDLSQHPDVEFAAPVGFGDSLGGYALVGTSRPLIDHLVGSSNEAHWFNDRNQVAAGSSTRLSIGDELSPVHGDMDSEDSSEHSGIQYEVVVRLPVTGTQWDHAVISPIGALWSMHGLGDPDHKLVLNELTPPVPIVVVRAKTVGALYSLRQQFNNDDTMAFFPAEVLGGLYRVLGSVASVVKAITLITQILVVVAVLLSVFILMRSMTIRFATLHALGAPQAYRFSLIWVFAATLIVSGILLGTALGFAAAHLLSQAISNTMQIPVLPELSISDLFASVVFFNATLLLASIAAWLVSRRQQADSLFG